MIEKKPFIAAIFLFCPLCLTPASALAGSAGPIAPEEYLVFSASNIGGTVPTTYDEIGSPIENGDYQGIVGAVGDVNVAHFSFSSDVIAGGNIRIFSGGIEGNAEAGGQVETLDGHISGDVTDDSQGADVGQLDNAATFYSVKSECYAGQGGRSPKNILGTLTFIADFSTHTHVFDLPQWEFATAHSLNFSGGPGDVFIVNVHGSDLRLSGIPLNISSAMSAGQVILNFPEATRLLISHSPTPIVGYQATILAPGADVILTEAGITGGLYAGAIINGVGNTQVNYAPRHWPDLCGSSR